jgi:hypothetical protein
MSKEHRYRKHIYWGQYAVPAFFILLFLLLLGLSIFLTFQSHVGFVAVFPAVLAFVFLIEGGVLWYLYYRLAGTSISVNDDVLIYKNRKSEKRYPLENIYLEFASIKYTGGWLKIKTDKDAIRLTVVLEDISGFLQELKTKLDNKQLSSHYDSHKLFGFLKTSAASDQSWERAYNLFGKMLLLILDISIAVFTGFVFGTIPIFGLALAIFWGMVSMSWVTIPYTIAEIVLMRQIAKKSNESTFAFPPRDLSYEKAIFDKAFMWGGITYFVFSLFTLTLTICIKILFQQQLSF